MLSTVNACEALQVDEINSRLSVQQKKRRLIKPDDLHGAFEIAHTLQEFVVDLKLFPHFSVIFGIPQLLQEVKQFCNDEGFYFCYDTTFNCGDLVHCCSGTFVLLKTQ